MVKDTSEMLAIIDNLNKSNTLISDCKLVSFDIINMFPSIDNISGLTARQDQFPVFALLKLLNYVYNVTILFSITNISYRVTV